MMARPGRKAALVGAVVAVSATTLMGLLAGTASATVPGSCLENVNVREEPTTTSPIVALCEAGNAVETGAVRNGFIQLTDLGGWAAEEYIQVDRTAAPASSSPSGSTPRSGSAPSTADDDAATSPRFPRTAAPATDDEVTGDTADSRDSGTSTNSGDADGSDELRSGPVEEPEPERGGIGGLFG